MAQTLTRTRRVRQRFSYSYPCTNESCSAFRINVDNDLKPIISSKDRDDVVLGVGEILTNYVKYTPEGPEEVKGYIEIYARRVVCVFERENHPFLPETLARARREYRLRFRTTGMYAREYGSLGVGIFLVDFLFHRVKVIDGSVFLEYKLKGSILID